MSGVRRIVAVILVLLFASNLPANSGQSPTQPSGSVTSIKEQVGKLPMGAFIEIRFTDKTKVRGYLSAVEADGFSFKVGSPTNTTVRQAAFTDVKSLKEIHKTHTPVGAWIAVGAIAAAVIIVVAIFAAERHNELGS